MAMRGQTKNFETGGRYVVIVLLLLTAIAGGLFIYLGPRATEKRPGVLHLGIRYTNERSVDFLRYGKEGPPARIAFIDKDGKAVRAVDKLERGRNLVPIGELPAGPYTARISAPGYEAKRIPVEIEARVLRPAPGFSGSANAHADRNMIGVRLSPDSPDASAEKTAQ
ncbi:MAG: hypothetical protein ACLFUF_03015 [Opitutales bacterium]